MDSESIYHFYLSLTLSYPVPVICSVIIHIPRNTPPPPFPQTVHYGEVRCSTMQVQQDAFMSRRVNIYSNQNNPTLDHTNSTQKTVTPPPPLSSTAAVDSTIKSQLVTQSMPQLHLTLSENHKCQI